MFTTFVIVSFSAIYATGVIATIISAETGSTLRRLVCAFSWPAFAIVIFAYMKMVQGLGDK